MIFVQGTVYSPFRSLLGFLGVNVVILLLDHCVITVTSIVYVEVVSLLIISDMIPSPVIKFISFVFISYSFSLIVSSCSNLLYICSVTLNLNVIILSLLTIFSRLPSIILNLFKRYFFNKLLLSSISSLNSIIVFLFGQLV